MLAFISNERNVAQEAQTGSEQGSFASIASILNFNVPRRARYHQPPVPPAQAEVVNFPVPPVVHIDATELAHTVAIVMSEKG